MGRMLDSRWRLPPVMMKPTMLRPWVRMIPVWIFPVMYFLPWTYWKRMIVGAWRSIGTNWQKTNAWSSKPWKISISRSPRSRQQSDLRLRFMRLYPRRVSVFLRSRTWRMISPWVYPLCRSVLSLRCPERERSVSRCRIRILRRYRCNLLSLHADSLRVSMSCLWRWVRRLRTRCSCSIFVRHRIYW